MHLGPRIEFLHRTRRALLAAHGVAGAPDEQPVAIGGRRIAHRPGGGVGGEVHAAGDVARHLVGHAVGAAGLEPGEEAAAIQNRNAGRQHALLGVHVEFVTRRWCARAAPDRRPHPKPVYANALRQPAAVLVEFDDQAVQQRHRIELRLVRQPDTAVIRERHVGVVHPFRVQPGGGARLQLGAPLTTPFSDLRVGVGILALHRDAVRLAVLNQPLLPFAIALHVLLAIFGPCLPTIFDILRALQQADLRGGVTGRACTRGVCLQHQHVLAGPGQQHRGDQSGDARRRPPRRRPTGPLQPGVAAGRLGRRATVSHGSLYPAALLSREFAPVGDGRWPHSSQLPVTCRWSARRRPKPVLVQRVGCAQRGVSNGIGLVRALSCGPL